PLSQSALASKLKADGYPVSQPTISNMQEAVSYLLPVIPGLLYGGMSKRQIRNILSLRKALSDNWDKYSLHIPENPMHCFDQVFSETLSIHNDSTKDFNFTTFQDELIAYIAQIFNCSYQSISLDLNEKESLQRFIELPPSPALEINEAELFSKSKVQQAYGLNTMTEADLLSLTIPKPRSEPPIRIIRTDVNTPALAQAQYRSEPDFDADLSDDVAHEVIHKFIDEHVLSPVETTARLSAIQGMVAGITGDSEPNFKTNVVKSIPVQAGGLYAISDVWHIGANLDNPDSLRTHIGQLVLEIAEESNSRISVQTIEDGLGFVCNSMQSTDWTGQILIQFLQTLAGQTATGFLAAEKLLPALAGLFVGGFNSDVNRLSDVAFVKLIRVLRLARRYHELNDLGQENS
ncbi:MAG: hypothetical protein ACRCWR_00685, partial [Saezia sp.]